MYMRRTRRTNNGGSTIVKIISDFGCDDSVDREELKGLV